jgi:hypothetical protein
VLLLGYADVAEERGRLGKAFLVGGPGEPGVERSPLEIFPGGGGLEVLGRVADRTGREGRADLDIAALQQGEEALGVLALLIGGLDRKSTRLNSSHPSRSRMPSSA